MRELQFVGHESQVQLSGVFEFMAVARTVDIVGCFLAVALNDCVVIAQSLLLIGSELLGVDAFVICFARLILQEVLQ